MGIDPNSSDQFMEITDLGFKRDGGRGQKENFPILKVSPRAIKFITKVNTTRL